MAWDALGCSLCLRDSSTKSSIFLLTTAACCICVRLSGAPCSHDGGVTTHSTAASMGVHAACRAQAGHARHAARAWAVFTLEVRTFDSVGRPICSRRMTQLMRQDSNFETRVPVRTRSANSGINIDTKRSLNFRTEGRSVEGRGDTLGY